MGISNGGELLMVYVDLKGKGVFFWLCSSILSDTLACIFLTQFLFLGPLKGRAAKPAVPEQKLLEVSSPYHKWLQLFFPPGGGQRKPNRSFSIDAPGSMQKHTSQSPTVH